MSSVNDTLTQAFALLAQFEQQEMSEQDQFNQLVSMINDMQTTINGLNGIQTNLSNQLQADEAELTQLQAQLAAAPPKDKPAIQAKIDAKNGDITTDQSKIAANQATINSDTSTLKVDKTALETVADEIKNNVSLSTAMQDIQNETPDSNPTSNTINPTNNSNGPLTAQQMATQLQTQINAYCVSVANITADIQTKIDDIQNKENDLNQAQSDEKQDLHKITELSCEIAACIAAAIPTFGASLVGVAYLTYELGCTIQDLIDTRKKESDDNSAITKDKTDLKTDFNTLKALEVGQINGVISTITDLLKSILPLMGNSSESAMQSAAAAVTQVLQYLQMLLTQVHEKHTEDQQYMSKGSTLNYEVSINKSEISMNQFGSDAFYAHFMKIVMTSAEVILSVAALVAAVASGGAGAILLAVMMSAMTTVSVASNGKYDAMDEMTSHLATAMQKGMGGSDELSKVLSDIVIAAAMTAMVLIADGSSAPEAVEEGAEVGASQAGGDVLGTTTAAAAKTAVNSAEEEAVEVDEIEMQPLGKSSASAVSKNIEENAEKQVSQLGKALENDLKSAEDDAAKNVGKNVAKTTTKKAFLKVLSRATSGMIMNFMITNGLVDSLQAIAKARGKENASYMQILKVVIGIVQAILMAVAARGSFAEAEQGQLVNAVLKKLGLGEMAFNLTSAAKINTVVAGVGMLLQAGSNAGMTVVNVDQAHILRDLGDTQYKIVIMQNILKSIQNFEQNSSQEFAVLIQQYASSLSATTQKMGQAEFEAARVMLETAV